MTRVACHDGAVSELATLLRPEHRWYCPNCGATDVTHEERLHVRMHSCGALAGFSAPMIEAGTNCKIEAHEREDYIGKELVQTDGHGRPIMNVTVTRDDGEDCFVYAPAATATFRS